jgi:hypothetical protein
MKETLPFPVSRLGGWEFFVDIYGLFYGQQDWWWLIGVVRIATFPAHGVLCAIVLTMVGDGSSEHLRLVSEALASRQHDESANIPKDSCQVIPQVGPWSRHCLWSWMNQDSHSLPY